LIKVIYIVTGHVPCQISDSDLASFSMYAYSFPFIGRELVQHPQVCLA
jgi:hypothetical protein